MIIFTIFLGHQNPGPVDDKELIELTNNFKVSILYSVMTDQQNKEMFWCLRAFAARSKVYEQNKTLNRREEWLLPDSCLQTTTEGRESWESFSIFSRFSILCSSIFNFFISSFHIFLSHYSASDKWNKSGKIRKLVVYDRMLIWFFPTPTVVKKICMCFNVGIIVRQHIMGGN